MILNDKEITDLCLTQGMIKPFRDTQAREAHILKKCGTYPGAQHVKVKKLISYGLSSYGYDIRLSDKFKIFTSVNSQIIDPKCFTEDSFVDFKGDICVMPPNSFVLAVSLERICMPDDVTGIVLGKSTYARCGLVVNSTPLEASWRGHITIELSNTAPLPLKIYAREGIAQVLFFKGSPCYTTYSDRRGKYQDQSDDVTLPKV